MLFPGILVIRAGDNDDFLVDSGLDAFLIHVGLEHLWLINPLYPIELLGPSTAGDLALALALFGVHHVRRHLYAPIPVYNLLYASGWRGNGAQSFDSVRLNCLIYTLR